jgi:hypothetical protein
MADPQQNYRDVLSRLEAKDKKGTSAQDLYDAASFLPGTGEAIAAYELPGILSQGGQMMQSDDVLEALQGMGLVTLGTAATLPIVGPAAKAARKGLEGFIPYMGPKLATEGPDSSIMAMTDFEPPKGGTKAADDIGLGSGSLFAPETKKNRRLLVLSCSDTKCPDVGDKKAIDRYLGPVFQSLKAMGTPIDVDVAIMSAKHGLIRSDTPIKKYDDKMTPKKAELFKQDANQMNRIRNTLEGYDDVIVQGGKDYKDVIRAAAGDAKITEVPGGRGIGDQRSVMKQALAFGKIDTPVYHFSMEPGFSKFDLDKLPFSDLGPHVGSTPKAAADRFFTKNYGIMPDLNKRYEGKTTDEILKDIQESGIKPDNPDFLGGSVPLKADLSKPFLNPATKKPFTETELTLYKANQLGRLSNNKFTRDDLYFENPNVSDDDIRQAMRKLSRELAEKGFTHIPYVNDFEDVKELSYVMLLDRPKGSTKVLQSPAAVKDPKKFEDADFMMEEGGVVSMKDKAVNMTRKPQGIEPFIKFVV